MELVLLSASAFSAISDGEFLVNWIGVVLSIEVNSLANILQFWIKRQ